MTDSWIKLTAPQMTVLAMVAVPVFCLIACVACWTGTWVLELADPYLLAPMP